MKKICTLLALLTACSLAQAITITSPLQGSNALSGENAYAWGVAVNLNGQTINSASITFTGVKLTVANSSGTGYLYADLLNLNHTGVTTYTDNDASGDYWKTQLSGANISSFGSDFFKSVGTTLNWTIVLNSTQLASLNSYLADGIFDIGIDPDCHYDLGSVCFNYTTTTSVPDATTTVFLLGISLIGLEVIRRQLAFRKTVTVKK